MAHSDISPRIKANLIVRICKCVETFTTCTKPNAIIH